MNLLYAFFLNKFWKQTAKNIMINEHFQLSMLNSKLKKTSRKWQIKRTYQSIICKPKINKNNKLFGNIYQLFEPI